MWDAATDPFTTTVKTTIGRLRVKLGDPPLIETIREAGYRIENRDAPASIRRTPLRWFRRHRRTARMRLTAVYGGLFLLSGVALLAITYLLARATDKPSYVEITGHALRTIPQSEVGHLHQFQAAVAVYQNGRDLSHQLIESGIALAIMAVVAVILGWIVAGRALAR